MPYQELKQRHRDERSGFHENLSLRTHRALSWYQKAEQSEDLDSRFLFCWIAFNAAYANDIDRSLQKTEKALFRDFFSKLLKFDKQHRLADLVWSEFSSHIRVLLDNPYIFQPFWDFHNGYLEEAQWKQQFTEEKQRVARGLGQRNTLQVLTLIFKRIYTLRNQLMHGGATWNSSANRSQLSDCTAFMMQVVPVVIELMMDHPDQLWGDPYYPYVHER